MKFLFIVQGEGRGHFTQAITLEEMLVMSQDILTRIRTTPVIRFVIRIANI